jgi:hypothetical protein
MLLSAASHHPDTLRARQHRSTRQSVFAHFQRPMRARKGVNSFMCTDVRRNLQGASRCGRNSCRETWLCIVECCAALIAAPERAATGCARKTKDTINSNIIPAPQGEGRRGGSR